MKILVRALEHDAGFHIHLKLIAGEQGLERIITHQRIQKQGLALTGFLDSLRPNRIQVLGKTELNYLQTLSEENKSKALTALMSSEVACIVITTGLRVPKQLLELADSQGLAIFRTPLASSIAISRLQAFLEEHLSPEISRHGVLVDVFGVGIFLSGTSGIGKSECALDLILRGHRLIADDTVLMKSRNQVLIGTGSPLTKHHMEVRGLGIINVKELFGAASVSESHKIELWVEMIEWNHQSAVNRTGLDELTETLLDFEIDKIVLPIRPGRNIASIVEVAARNHLLKLQGHNSAQEFQNQLVTRLSEAAKNMGNK